ncbi:MAG: hypothetical protein RJA25_1918 [Bacteroidota bacterium]|jgi:heat shock protein HslJ
MKAKIILVYLLLTNVFSYSTEYLKIIYIANYTATCGEQKCLLARDAPEQSYKILEHNIEGFHYKEGFEYCLLVTLKQTDSLNFSYTLNEIKSKIKTNVIVERKSNLLDSSIWLLYKLRMKDGSNRTFSIQKSYLQFDVNNNTFNGNTGCNTISGDFTLENNIIHFDNIISTQMACGKHSIEPEFLKLLANPVEIKVNSKMLYLQKGKTLLGLFTKKK